MVTLPFLSREIFDQHCPALATTNAEAGDASPGFGLTQHLG
jgi:hypothetical protein